MKVRLPFVNRKAHDKEVEELVKDIKVKEAKECASEELISRLKVNLQEKDREVENLRLELSKRDKEVIAMNWSIKERDKELDKIREFNMELYKKVELATEMQRQVKDKIDIAFNIDVIEKERTEHGAKRIITANDIKKLLKGEDLVEIYTKLALMV